MRSKRKPSRLQIVQELTRLHLKPKHVAYATRWAKKLELQDMDIALYIYPTSMDKTTAAKVHFNLDDNWARIGLSMASLQHGTDWRNSIVHELLHLTIRKRFTSTGKLPESKEEDLVILLAGLLARAPINDLL